MNRMTRTTTYMVIEKSDSYLISYKVKLKETTYDKNLA